MTIEDVLKKDELALALDQAETPADFRAIFAAEGVSENGINHFLLHLSEIPAAAEDTKTETGVPLAVGYLSKWAYRVQQGQWS